MHQTDTCVRIAGIVRESIVDGPGLRFVVFAQGCPHRCDGCHNPQTWDQSGGSIVPLSRLLEEIEKNPLLRGITLSGGEPFGQAQALATLADRVRKKGMNVISYSGYTFEQLYEMAQTDPSTAALLQQTDYLIDGPFVQEQRDLSLRYRGSRNQRILDCCRSLEEGMAVPAEALYEQQPAAAAAHA